MTEKRQSSYRQIFKSSAMIGGSTVANLAIGLVRTKLAALLIGIEGMGILGAFSSISGLACGIAGMGLNTSGVRQVAAAAGANDPLGVARTALVLSRASLISGTLGALGLFLLSDKISVHTFGTPAYSWALAVLSLTVLFGSLAGGQVALLQGLRRIRELAAQNVLGALVGTAVSIPILYFLREEGISLFLVAVSAVAAGASWWFARKSRITQVEIPLAAALREVRMLLTLGFAFMATGLMASGVIYLTRLIIIRQLDLNAAGLFQAASAVSTIYVGFILTAMGADYYPRLTAVADSNKELNLQVNEQTESALLMALPGLLVTLVISPWVLTLLYTAQFTPAAEVLRWQIFGVLGRVALWPAGFVLMAKGRAGLFILTELITNFMHVGMIWFGLKWFGLAGAGMAFAGAYLFYGLILIPVVNRLTGFNWTTGNWKLIGGAVCSTACTFILTRDHGTGLPGLMVASSMALTALLYSAYRLSRRMGYPDVSEMLRAELAKIRDRLSGN